MRRALKISGSKCVGVDEGPVISTKPMAESMAEILLGSTGTILAEIFAGICAGKQQDSPTEEAVQLAHAGAACLQAAQQRGERLPLRLTGAPEVEALEKAAPESGILRRFSFWGETEKNTEIPAEA